MGTTNNKHRRSIRLQKYDYSNEGLYFITICTNHHLQLFGDIINNEMRLNHAGKIIEKWYSKIHEKFPTITCIDHIIMPNHFHCILGITYDAENAIPVNPNLFSNKSSDGNTSSARITIFQAIRWLKVMTTNEYIKGVKSNVLPSFDKHLWQRNYYEHIIRDFVTFDAIVKYIRTNPSSWNKDSINPDIPAINSSSNPFGNL